MERVITVEATGYAEVKPDLTIVTLGLKTLLPIYEESIKLAAKRYESIVEAITRCGLTAEDVKTSHYDIHAKYHSKEYRGENKDVFDGWQCSQDLKVEFPLNMDLLGKILTGICKSGVECKMQVKFAVEKSEEVQSVLLESAAKNAMRKAEILCNSAGGKLGQLIKIDYDWDNEDNYRIGTCCEGDSGPAMDWMSLEITPENIKAESTITFVWAIE